MINGVRERVNKQVRKTRRENEGPGYDRLYDEKRQLQFALS